MELLEGDFDHKASTYWYKTHKEYSGAPRTKIICTIGRETGKKEWLRKMLESGMNVARCNFSHEKLCAVLLDTKGPEIRTQKLKNHEKVQLNKGATCRIWLDKDEKFQGTAKAFSCDYKNLSKVVKKGSRILIDDGLIEVVVTECGDNYVEGIIQNDGLLGENKGVNLPGVITDLPAVTKKDHSDLLFGVKKQVDFVAASFIRNAAGVKEIRKILGEKGKNIKIIAKIENQEGIENFDEILKVADGIMVARGDMGVEIPIEEVIICQKDMIRKCNQAGKPVVTATQMLESMQKNPGPTRAETSDVANAVFDGSDCVMLSGETASGKYPLRSILAMKEICTEAECRIDYLSTFQTRFSEQKMNFQISEAIATSAVQVSFACKAGCIIVMTSSGRTAQLVSKYRSTAHILAVTDSEKAACHCMVYRGIHPLLVNSMDGTDSLVFMALEEAKKMKMVNPEENVVVCSGVLGNSGSTNMLKVLKCH